MKGQKIKRLLALAIAAAMFLSTGSGALAEGTSPSESTTAQTVADGETQSTAKRKASAAIKAAEDDFVIQDGVLTEYYGEGGNVVIPDGVTAIGSLAFCNNKTISSVTIPTSVTSIGSEAFSGCTSMTAIVIPDSVTLIDWEAFSGCTGLMNVTIGNSVTTIGNKAFYNCSGLTGVTFGSSVESIGESAFYGCKGLTAVTLPGSLTSIGASAFSGCTGLTAIVIPGAVTTIGNSAFYGCTGITRITLGSSVKTIGASAFYGCSKFTSITIPNSVTSIGNFAFYNCTALRNVTLGKSVKTIGDSAFSYCALTSITIPDSVTTIGASAFSSCQSLKQIAIPDSVTSVGNSAFYNCKALTSVSLSKSVKTIGASTFYECGFTSITIPDSVTSIQNWAFGYSGLKQVNIPSSVTSIGDYSFYSCQYLTSAVIPRSVTSIGAYAFDNVNNSFTIRGYTGSYAQQYASNRNKKFTAIKEYTITYDGNGGLGAPAPQTKTENQGITLSNTQPEREGYTFVGWALTKAATEAAYNPGDVFEIDANTTLYAVWKEIVISSISVKTLPAGTQSIAVTYEEQSTSFDVTVNEIKLTGISIQSMPEKTVYYVGETLDTTGLVLKATYNNGTTKEITSGFTCNPTKLNTAGTQSITVTYQGKTASFDVTVNQVVLTGISILSKPSKTAYNVGDTLDTTGLVLKATYSNSTSEEITSGFTCNPTKLNTAGTQSITVTYQGKTASFDVTVENKLSIVKHPENVETVSGHQVTFSVTATGEGLSYQWYYKKADASDWSLWHIYTEPTIHPSSNDTWDGMQVYCKVTDETGAWVSSHPATVTLIAASESDLKFLSHPENVNVNEGDAATFSVTVQGNGLTYRWYYAEKGGTGWILWEGQNTSTASGKAEKSWNGRQVYCVVTDENGESISSNLASITVTDPLIITSQPVNQTFEVGHSVTVSLRAEGSGLTYQWYFKKKGQTSFSPWNGRTHATETCTPNATWDGIQLYCVVKDSTGKTLQSETITVSALQSLKITSQPTGKTIKLGDSLKVSLKAEGIGLTYQWYFKKTTQTSFSPWKGHTNATETCTPNATWNGIQLYCIVKDSAGNSVQSNTITVKVNSAGITITQQPQNQSIVAGTSINLTVKATGSSLKYQWYFKKKGQTSFNIWNGRTHATETVSPNSTWDGIQLYCKITDGSGKTLNSSTVTINVLSITTQPSNVTVAAGSNATFKVVATGSGLKYQWQYKKSGQTSWNNWGARTTASTTATSNATWQGMQVRCIVTDSAGNKVTSNAATITIK